MNRCHGTCSEFLHMYNNHQRQHPDRFFYIPSAIINHITKKKTNFKKPTFATK